MSVRAIFVAAIMATAPMAVAAAPNEQLLRSIEHRLTFWNVGPVDYQTLTTAQASALHLKLTNAPSRFSQRAFLFRQELKTILQWDGSERKHSIRVSD